MGQDQADQDASEPMIMEPIWSQYYFIIKDLLGNKFELLYCLGTNKRVRQMSDLFSEHFQVIQKRLSLM